MVLYVQANRFYSFPRRNLLGTTKMDNNMSRVRLGGYIRIYLLGQYAITTRENQQISTCSTKYMAVDHVAVANLTKRVCGQK